MQAVSTEPPFVRLVQSYRLKLVDETALVVIALSRFGSASSNLDGVSFVFGGAFISPAARASTLDPLFLEPRQRARTRGMYMEALHLVAPR